MKTITINTNRYLDCLECPFCKYLVNYNESRAEYMGYTIEYGFYCTNGNKVKFLSEACDGGEINIPDWCEL